MNLAFVTEKTSSTWRTKNDSTKKIAMLCKSGYQIVIFIFLLNLTNKVRCCRVVGTTLTALKESLIYFNKSLFMLFLKILCFPFAYIPAPCPYCDYTLVKSTASTNFESFWVQFKSSPIILRVLHLLARLKKLQRFSRQ